MELDSTIDHIGSSNNNGDGNGSIARGQNMGNVCLNCGKELGDNEKYCKDCSVIKFPIEELGFLKRNFEFFKDQSARDINSLKSDIRNYKDEIDNKISILNTPKRIEAPGIKIASIILLFDGLISTFFSGILMTFGGLFSGFLGMMGKGGLNPINQPNTNLPMPFNPAALSNLLLLIGLIGFSIGILYIVFSYYLWKGNKTAAIFIIGIYSLSLISQLLSIVIYGNLIPMIGQTIAWTMVPGIIMTVMPIILIISDWDTLK